MLASQDRQQGRGRTALLAGRVRAALQLLRDSALPACYVVFVLRFDPNVAQRGLNVLWLAGLALWLLECRRLNGAPLLRALPRRADVVPIAILLIVFAAVWLPFYNNWRWAYTGDSIVWYSLAADAARDGLYCNLLSTFGVDGHFTYLHSLAFNGFLFLVEPTFFWHRVGKLTVSCLSLVAIYAFFTVTVGRGWAALIVLCTAVNYVWIWFSFVSYGHIDSYLFYFLTLLGAVLVWRRPDDLGGWVLAGLVGGLSVFFTQTAWSAVAAVGLALGVYALATRRIIPGAVYAISFLVAAGPALLQWDSLMHMTTKQAAPLLEPEYLRRMATIILQLPFWSPHANLGVWGALLRPPLGQAYVAGAVLAAAALVPPVRHRLRVPAVAPALLLLLLWDTALLTLTNNAYSMPSPKRTYSLIPLQIFFALLPALVVARWAARWRPLHAAVLALTLTGVLAYAAASLRVIANPPAGLYGSNVYDGLIEVRQRFAERPAVLFTSRRFADWMERFLDDAYAIRDTVEIRQRFELDAEEAACRSTALLCYEPNFDQAAFAEMVSPLAERLQRVSLLNSEEMVCLACAPAPPS